MRKLYFLIAILFLSSAVNAQYSFDAANTNPSAGNTYTLYKVETTVPVGAAGADVSYDFSSQSTATEVTGKWEATTTGSPDIFYSDPNVGVPDIKFSYDSTIYFYLTSSNGLQTVGRATSYGGIFGVYQQMPYNVKANVFSYPFDYGDKETTTLDIAYSYLVQGQPVTGNVTGNLTGNVTGNVTGNLTGNPTVTELAFSSTLGKIKEASVTVSSVDLLALNAGGNFTLIAAAGSNRAIIPMSITIKSDPGATAFNFNESLYIGHENEVSSTSTDYFAAVGAGFVNNATVLFRHFPVTKAANEHVDIRLNDPLVLHATGTAAVTTGNGDLKVKIIYREVDFT